MYWSVLRAMGLSTRVGLGNRKEQDTPHEPDVRMGVTRGSPMFKDMNYHYSSDFVCPFFLRSLAMPNPTQKTTITRCAHMVDAFDRPYWGYNSDELAKIDPMCPIAGFPFLPPTATQRPSDHTMPEVDSTHSTLEFLWGPDLGSLHTVAQMGVTAFGWSANSGLAFPSMDPLAMPVWNQEVKQRRATTEDIFGLDSGLQDDQPESV